MKRHLLGFLVSTAFVLQAGPASANLLTNGSLTGPIANGGVPSGWVVVTPSPDTMDENNNVGVPLPGAPFAISPSGPSPDGGTWVGFARDGGFIESFGQTVGGLVIGQSYQLSWYVGNFGTSCCGVYDNPNRVEALLDGVSAGLGSTIALGSGWTYESISIVAAATTQLLSFHLGNTDRSYFSLDGIDLVAAQAVPEPATLALLTLCLAGLSFTRKFKA